MKVKAKKTTAKELPKTFRGARGMRGLGMKSNARAPLTEKSALDGFDATREFLTSTRRLPAKIA
jgi:hypothetical protein